MPNKYVCWVLYVKFRTEKHWLVKHFAFLKNVFYKYLNFVLLATYCFFTICWLAHNQLSWNVLLFSCNPIGQLCLGGPGYSSRTITNEVLTKEKSNLSSCWMNLFRFPHEDSGYLLWIIMTYEFVLRYNNLHYYTL